MRGERAAMAAEVARYSQAELAGDVSVDVSVPTYEVKR